LGLPVGATINCADNTGGKNLHIVSVYGIKVTDYMDVDLLVQLPGWRPLGILS